ncbi:MAG: cation:proton antiporter [Coriobacteriia bacterium]|nr:cation:proton antiporter [Coriobacteriia bacterium]
MEVELFNLLAVSGVAFAVPLVIGFFPKLRVPSIAIEIVAGIILGPMVLDWIHPDVTINVFSAVGVAFLLFLAGLELDLDVLKGAPMKLGAASFFLSFAIALAVLTVVGRTGFVLSPLLVAIALSATSVGIVIPVLRDTGELDSSVGKFVLGGGAVAEFGTIALLGVFFARENASSIVETGLLLVVAVLAVGLLWLLRYATRWQPARPILDRLDNSSAQIRVRLALLVLLASAVLATTFGFEAILGTFLAGIVFGIVIKGDQFEERLRHKLEAIGFGFFVPVFFVSSGLRLDLSKAADPTELLRVAFFLLMLLAVRGLPAMVYRRHLSWRETAGAGLLQATNLSFIVVAVTVGGEIGIVRPVNGAALVIAGLISALVFPVAAQRVLSSGGAVSHDVDSEESHAQRVEERM